MPPDPDRPSDAPTVPNTPTARRSLSPPAGIGVAHPAPVVPPVRSQTPGGSITIAPSKKLSPPPKPPGSYSVHGPAFPDLTEEQLRGHEPLDEVPDSGRGTVTNLARVRPEWVRGDSLPPGRTPIEQALNAARYAVTAVDALSSSFVRHREANASDHSDIKGDVSQIKGDVADVKTGMATVIEKLPDAKRPEWVRNFILAVVGVISAAITTGGAVYLAMRAQPQSVIVVPAPAAQAASAKPPK